MKALLVFFLLLIPFFSAAGTDISPLNYYIYTDTVKIKNIDNSLPESLLEKNSSLLIMQFLIGIITILSSYLLAIKTTARQHHSVLYSNNRQQWVNDVRKNTSNFIAQAKQLNIAYQAPVNDEMLWSNIREKLDISEAMLLILLNPEDNSSHRTMHNGIKALIASLDYQLTKARGSREFVHLRVLNDVDVVIDSARIVCYQQWKLIQEKF